MMMPTGLIEPRSTAIVVLSWEGKYDTLRCVESLMRHGEGATVVVVDNGSTDGTVHAVRSNWPEVRVVENSANLGFSAGNNRGVELAVREGFEVVGMINNDTVVTPSFLPPLLEVLALDPPHRYVSPQIRYLGDQTRIWFAGAEVSDSSGIMVHRSLDSADAVGVVPTPMVTGCALFAHREAWTKVGLLDEGYFLIFEDAEWSRRANLHGLTGLVANESVILHAVSATIETSASSVADYYYARNGIRFILTGPGGRSRGAIRFMARCLRDSARELRRSRGHSRRSVGAPLRQLHGFVDGFRGRMGPRDQGRRKAE